jgi:agmatinase
MEVKELMNDPGIWAGQNKPGASIEEADIVVFSIPYDGGVSFRAGAKDAPQALREITYTISPTTETFESFDGINVVDLGDIPGENRDELFLNAETTTCDIVKAGKFFVMVGGDHSVTIPVQRGVDKALDEPLGIIHIDAHFDLCDKLNGDLLSHGATERRALELENISGVESIFFIGIRSVEMEELEFIRKNGVNCLSSKDIGEIGIEAAISKVKEHFKGYENIYLTVDIDCLDPAFAPGTGTPQFGGLTSRELLTLLRGLFDLPIIGMDVVEVAPKLDDSLVAVFAARKIITECWGHHLRKQGKLK